MWSLFLNYFSLISTEMCPPAVQCRALFFITEDHNFLLEYGLLKLMPQSTTSGLMQDHELFQSTAWGLVWPRKMFFSAYCYFQCHCNTFFVLCSPRKKCDVLFFIFLSPASWQERDRFFFLMNKPGFYRETDCQSPSFHKLCTLAQSLLYPILPPARQHHSIWV